MLLFRNVCINLQFQSTLRIKSANVVRFVSTLIAVIRVKPARQTNMPPRSLGTNSPVILIVIYAVLIWPSIEGRKQNCICMYLSSMHCKLDCYTADARLIRNSVEIE